jgi:single-strand DNA-binding protein
MACLNQVQLIGAVGKDPEIRYLDDNPQNPKKVATFRIATTERYKDLDGNQKEQTEWHNITVWNGKAVFVEKYVKKGNNLFISGKLATRQWTDQSGNKRYTTEVVAENIQMLDRKPKENKPVIDEDLPDFLQ